MRLGIGGDGNLEIGDPRAARPPGRRHRHSRRDAAHRRRRRARRRAAPRCGARRHPSRRAPRHPPRRGSAPTQVRCAAGVSVVSAHDAADGGVGARLRAAAGAVGDGDEPRAPAVPAGGCRPRAASPAPRCAAGRTRTQRGGGCPASRRRQARQIAGRSASVPAWPAVRRGSGSKSWFICRVSWAGAATGQGAAAAC